MRKSRLKLFKTTSLTISLIGVVLILLTVGVIGYVAVSGLTNTVSNTVSSGSSYDQLDALKSEYGNATKKYDDLNAKLGTSPNPNVKTKFNDGKIKLSEAGQKVSSIQADIDRGKSGKDVDDKISQTRELLKEADNIYNEISGTS